MFELFNRKKDEGPEKEEIIYVDRDTHIEGNIRTDTLVVEGKVTGTVRAGNVILKQGACIRGEVFTHSLLLDDDIQCDCEFHIDRRFSTDDTPAETVYEAPTGNRVAAAV